MAETAQGSATESTGGDKGEIRQKLLSEIEQAQDKDSLLIYLSSLTDEQKLLITDDWSGFLKQELMRRDSGQGNNYGGGEVTAGAAMIDMAASGVGAILRSPMSLAKGAGGLAKVSLDQFREGRVKRAYKGQDAAFKQASALLGGLSEHEGFSKFVLDNQDLKMSSSDIAKEMRPGGKLEGRFKDFNNLMDSDPKLKSMMEGLTESVDAFARDGSELTRLTGKYPKMEMDINNVRAPIAAQGFESTLSERGESLDKALSGMPLPEFDDEKALVSFKAVNEKLEDMMESIKRLVDALKSLIRLK